MISGEEKRKTCRYDRSSIGHLESPPLCWDGHSQTDNLLPQNKFFYFLLFQLIIRALLRWWNLSLPFHGCIPCNANRLWHELNRLKNISFLLKIIHHFVYLFTVCSTPCIKPAGQPTHAHKQQLITETKPFWLSVFVIMFLLIKSVF